jgi:hypothetical protein
VTEYRALCVAEYGDVSEPFATAGLTPDGALMPEEWDLGFQETFEVKQFDLQHRAQNGWKSAMSAQDVTVSVRHVRAGRPADGGRSLAMTGQTATCQACGQISPGLVSFCGWCGAPQSPPVAPAAPAYIDQRLFQRRLGRVTAMTATWRRWAGPAGPADPFDHAVCGAVGALERWGGCASLMVPHRRHAPTPGLRRRKAAPLLSPPLCCVVVKASSTLPMTVSGIGQIRQRRGGGASMSLRRCARIGEGGCQCCG